MMRLIDGVAVDDITYGWLRTLAVRAGLCRGLEVLSPSAAARVATAVIEGAYLATRRGRYLDLEWGGDND